MEKFKYSPILWGDPLGSVSANGEINGDDIRGHRLMVKWKTAKIPLIPYKPSSPESAPQSCKSHRLLLLSWCNHLAANPLNNFHLPTRSPVLYTYMHTVIKANCAEDSWYLNFHPCHQDFISSAPTYYTTCVHFVRAWLVGPWSAVLIRKIAHCLH